MRTETPNHALQRTAPRVTLAAPTASLRSPPATFPQPARRAPQSLSLGSFGDISLSLATEAKTVTTMQFIHAREHLNDGDVFEVDCDTKCNVQITTDSEFSDYKAGRSYRYFGGYFTHYPVRLSAPHSGYWNLTIDVGEGYEANIRYSITVIRKG